MKRCLILTLLLLLSLPGGDARAAWSHDIETNDALADAAGDQHAVQLVPDGSGGHYAAWLDVPANTVYVQHLDRDGRKMWSGQGVSALTAYGFATIYAVAADGTGGLLVAVQDSDDATYFHIFVQRLNAAGSRLWGTAGVKVAPGVANTSLTAPAIAADGSGGAFAAWIDGRNGNNDIYAQHINSSGARQWSTNALAVCTATATQRDPVAVADAAGGVYFCWQDERNTGSSGVDVFGQYLNGAGGIAWPTNGLAICFNAGDQLAPQAGSDGQGGVIVSWLDERDVGANGTDLYAQRILPSGNFLWDWQGSPVCVASSAVADPRMAGDGDGGAWFAWADDRSDGTSGQDIYLQGLRGDASPRLAVDGQPVAAAAGEQIHVALALTSDGDVAVSWTDPRAAGIDDIQAQLVDPAGAPLWGSAGRAVCQAPFGQDQVALAPDARGGVVFGWEDGRSAVSDDIYLQRIDRSGHPGDPAPALTGVHDFPQDQGGVVRLDWNASWLDAPGQGGIDAYLVWNRLASAKRTAELPALSPDTGLPAAMAAALAAGWTLVAEVGAYELEAYGFNAPTFADSTSAGAPVTEFMVMASAPGGLFVSNVLGGWSVDNLAPGAPLFLVVDLVVVDAVLGWSPSGWDDEDLHHYNIYRSLAPGVAITGGNRLASSTGPTFTDPELPGGEWYYVVTAVDVHGNEGPPSNEVMMLGISAVGDLGVPARPELRGAWPNPFNPVTVVTFGIPRAGPARLDVFNLAGRHIATLADGTLTAGYHEIRWNGRDEGGRAVASGVYMVRLVADGGRRTLKLMLTK